MGSISCRNAEVVIELVERLVRARISGVRGLILTGSAARSEATVLETATGVLWLSDIEFLVVVKNMAEVRKVATPLGRLARECEAALAAEGVQVSVELTPAPERYFCSIRPRLFGYELLCHGKQLYGKTDYLACIPSFGKEEIPREEALRLLSNRIVEWLDIAVDPGTLPAEQEFYSLVKKYLDVNTALTILSLRYEPSYEARSAAATEMTGWLSRIAPRLVDTGFPRAHEVAARFKNAPESPEFDWLRKSPESLSAGLRAAGCEWFLEGAPRILSSAWYWAVSEVAGVPAVNRGEALRAFRHLQTPAGWAKGWGRILLRPHLRIGASVLGRFPRLAAAGTPRSLIYVCAEQLLECHAVSDAESVWWVNRHLPALFQPVELEWSSLARQCVRNWNLFVRQTQT